MIKINLQIDKFHLAYKYILKYFGKEEHIPEEWVNLKKDLASKYEAYPGFQFFDPEYIGYGLQWAGFDKNGGKNIVRDKITVLKIFNEIFKSEIFKEKYAEVELYTQQLETGWKANEHYFKVYEEVTGLDINGEMNVLLLHPELETGSHIEDNLVEWGNPDLYENYQFIGLCHEYLHVLTKAEYNNARTEEDKWLLHSIIYLSADEEFRQRINGANGYFNSGVVMLYHERLINTARKVLPYWEEYIAKKADKNIKLLYERLRKIDLGI